MEIALTADLEALISEQVESGNYPSPGEVVRAALHLLKGELEKREPGTPRDLEEVMDDLSCKAEQRGLTPEILEQLLHEH